MANKIKDTPILTGKDAKKFVRDNIAPTKVSKSEKSEIFGSFERMKSISKIKF